MYKDRQMLYDIVTSAHPVSDCKSRKGEYNMSEILEIIMIVSFGLSWPMNVVKAYKARTAKGKSLGFLLLILFGYICGITSKFLNEAYMASFSEKWYVVIFYILNFCMVSADLLVYIRNRRLDKQRESALQT